MKVEEAVVHRRRVDLEVARVDHGAQRRLHRERKRVSRAVRDLNELHPKASELDSVSRTHLVENRVLVQLVLLEPAFDKRPRQARRVDGYVELRENVRDRADMVLMAVRQHQPSDLFAVLDEVADIGDDDVHSEQLAAGKHHAGVDDDQVASAAQGEHVHAELAKTAKRNNVQLLIRQGSASAGRSIVAATSVLQPPVRGLLAGLFPDTLPTTGCFHIKWTSKLALDHHRLRGVNHGAGPRGTGHRNPISRDGRRADRPWHARDFELWVNGVLVDCFRTLRRHDLLRKPWAYSRDTAAATS